MLYIGYVQMKSNKLQKVTALFKIVYYLRTGPVGVFFITGGQHVYSLMCLCAQDTTNFKSGINSTIFTAVVFWLSTRQRCNSQAQKTLRECVGWGEKCGNVFVIRQQKLCLGCCFFFYIWQQQIYFVLIWGSKYPLKDSQRQVLPQCGCLVWVCVSVSVWSCQFFRACVLSVCLGFMYLTLCLSVFAGVFVCEEALIPLLSLS